MVEIFAFLILVISLGGIFFLFFKKKPLLETLPIQEKESYFSQLKKRTIKFNPFKKFSIEIFLQKILAKIRIISLKIDNLTFNWLKKLRERYQEKKKKVKDNYWDEIKKAK